MAKVKRESLPEGHGIELVGSVRHLKRTDGTEPIFVGFTALRDGTVYQGTFLSDALARPPFSVVTLMHGPDGVVCLPTEHSSKREVLSLTEDHVMVLFIHTALNRVGCGIGVE